MYNGKIESYSVKKKKKVNFKSFFLWYLGIVISFFPIFADMIVFKSKNEQFTEEYWIGVCLRGDILWILATVIILTIIDYFSDNNETKKGFKLGCAIIGAVMWGVVFAIWIIFKYIYAADYEKDFPVVITLIVAGFTLTFCSPLQVKMMEVKG